MHYAIFWAMVQGAPQVMEMTGENVKNSHVLA